ncbi:MAG: hypothetical protein HZB91_14400 [Elusimicrobia bacterium]|nr:hypothetical protein [Elusimicrobiota bacterium]
MTNAVCHRDYLSAAHIQVRIYDRELLVMNPGGLPAGLSVEALKQTHHSIPRNRQVAEMLFYAGLIEQWGSGIEKMMRECSAAGMPEPAFESDMAFKLTFKKAAQEASGVSHGTSHETSHERPMSSTEERVRSFCKRPRSREDIAAELRLSPEYVRRHVLPGLIRAGKLQHTIPGKPQSRKQRYLMKPT